MGDEPGAPPPTPEQRRAFARKLEELEMLGVPVDALKKVIEERPQDFEREAEAAMRRELLGESEGAPAGDAPVRISGASPPAPTGPLEAAPAPEPEAEPAPGPAPEPVEGPRAEPAQAPQAAPDAPSEPAVAVDAAGDQSSEPSADVRAPVAEQTHAPGPPELPPNEVPAGSLEELEAKLAAYMAAAPAAEPAQPAPTPAVLESPAATAGVESDMSEELRQALEERAAAPSTAEPGAPPLASGDSLSLGAPAPAPSKGPKPPPPTGRAAPSAAVPTPAPPAGAKRVVVRAAPAAAAGAAPAAPAAAAPPADATAVLPAAETPRRSGLKAAAAVAVVALVLAGTYFAVVNNPPNAAFSFSPSAPTAGEPVFFTSNGTVDPNGDAVTFRWQWGDGSPDATTPTASHTFPRSGAYVVNLTATDDHKNAATAQKTVDVAAGTITPPIYAYGDRLDFTVTGHSHVEGVLGPITTVQFDWGTFHGSCGVAAVDLDYDGPQTRSVGSDAVQAADGFLQSHSTYVLDRSLAGLRLLGQINMSAVGACPVSTVAYGGTATLDEKAFANPDNNDTVRGESAEDLQITVNSDPPRDFDSSARLTDFPSLKDAAGQLHLEKAYAGARFSTEDTAHGNFTAEGLDWSWITQGASIVAGALAVKVHFEATNLNPTKVSRLYVDLWVSSTSSFPLREVSFVSGIDGGNRYTSLFNATASAEGVPGGAAIPFGTGGRNYAAVNASELQPLAVVPRATAGSDFDFTPRDAYNESVAACPDLVNFMAANPNAYAINGTYSRSTGNPKWTLDFSQSPNAPAERVEDEHSGLTQVTCGGGQGSANKTRAELGQVVSLDYAAGLLAREPTAAALFPVGKLDQTHANFTVRQNVSLPTVSLNAAVSASRSAVPYAFGAESLSTETVRIRAFVDAQTGQLVFALRETGESLP